jgi:7-carboxy-7-deazaguanine synthase
MNTLRLSEVFGPTIQGEGPSQGRAAWFVRLSGCNLSCSWCDTPYTWDWSGQNGTVYNRADESYARPVADLALELNLAMAGEILVLTGGEPLIQQRALSDLVSRVPGPVEVETNGTRYPTLSGVQFNISPKLDNAGCEGAWRPDVLDAYPEGSILKFVVDAPADFDEVEQRLGTLKVQREVWVMPQGKTRAEVEDKLGWVFGGAAARGWNVSSRLHVLTYGDRRGV